jgi:two-component system response regulator QseB
MSDSGPKATSSYILLVEDNPDSAEATIEVLERARYKVRWVNTAAAARAVLGPKDSPHAAPELMLLDLTLPDQSGIALVAELRKARIPVPPIIVLSAKTGIALREESQAMKAAGYLRKPFRIDELVGLVGSVLGEPTRPLSRQG